MHSPRLPSSIMPDAAEPPESDCKQVTHSECESRSRGHTVRSATLLAVAMAGRE
jgi:hypothetical protein